MEWSVFQLARELGLGSETLSVRLEGEVQKATDAFVVKTDEIVKAKEQEILEV